MHWFFVVTAASFHTGEVAGSSLVMKICLVRLPLKVLKRTRASPPLGVGCAHTPYGGSTSGLGVRRFAATKPRVNATTRSPLVALFA